MTVYGPEYIDLLFANSSYGKQLYNMAGSFSQMKAELLNKQLERYRNQYIPNMVKTDNQSSAKAQEVIKMLQDIGVTENKVGDKLVESIQTRLDKDSTEITTSGSQIGDLTRSNGKAVSYQAVGNLTEGNLNKMKAKEEMINILNNLVNNLQTVIDDANSKLKQIYDMIAASDAVTTTALQHLAGISDGTLPADSVFSAALGKNAAKKIQSFVLTTEEQAAVKALATNNPDMFKLVNDYSRIQGEIASLRYLKAGVVSEGAIQDATEGKGKSEAVRQLVGKIGGSFSDASSVFSETVVKTAASGALCDDDDVVSALEELIQAHVKTMATTSGGIGDFTRVTAKLENCAPFQQDLSAYTEWEKKELNATNNKDDVFLSVTSDEIAFGFGISVKASAKSMKKGKQGKATSLKLEQDTNLLHVFTTLASYDAGVSLPGIYNLAGGAAGDLQGYGVPSKLRAKMWEEQRQDLYSKNDVSQAWDNLVDYAETSYFLSALAGNGSLLNNSLFLSYNNKLIPISAILSGAASYISSGDNKTIASFRSGKASTSRQAISFKSNQFVNAKKGQTTEEAAFERSAKAEQNLTEAFQKRKITTFLNTTFLTAVANSL